MPPVHSSQADAAGAGTFPRVSGLRAPPPPFRHPAPCASTRPITAHPAVLSLVFPTVLKALLGTQVPGSGTLVNLGQGTLFQRTEEGSLVTSEAWGIKKSFAKQTTTCLF